MLEAANHIEVFLYDSKTGEFLRSEPAFQNQRDPAKYLMPRHSTVSKPPYTDDHETALWDGEEWAIAADYRSEKFYSISTGNLVELALGEVPDSTMTSIQPGQGAGPWDPEKEDWSYPVLYDKSTGDRVLLSPGDSPDYSTMTPIAPGPFSGPWDRTANDWSVDEQLVEARRLELLESLEGIRAERERNYRGTCAAHGITWDTGHRFLANITLATDAYDSAPAQVWRDAENQDHTIQSLSWLQTIRAAISADMMVMGEQLYQAKWTKRLEIEALTAEQIEQYDLYSGWPF